MWGHISSTFSQSTSLNDKLLLSIRYPQYYTFCILYRPTTAATKQRKKQQQQVSQSPGSKPSYDLLTPCCAIHTEPVMCGSNSEEPPVLVNTWSLRACHMACVVFTFTN